MEGSTARNLLDAIEDRITPPLPEPIQFSPIRIRQDEPPQRPGESWEDYGYRLTGHFKDAKGRLRSSDGRLSLLDEKNMRQYNREMFRFYDYQRGQYDMQKLRATYSF